MPWNKFPPARERVSSCNQFCLLRELASHVPSYLTSPPPQEQHVERDCYLGVIFPLYMYVLVIFLVQQKDWNKHWDGIGLGWRTMGAGSTRIIGKAPAPWHLIAFHKGDGNCLTLCTFVNSTCNVSYCYSSPQKCDAITFVVWQGKWKRWQKQSITPCGDLIRIKTIVTV